MQKEHSHVLGGSTAEQRKNCAGSNYYESQVPDIEESTEFADRGNMLHSGMELLITADPDNMTEAKPLLQQLIGQDMGYAGHEIDQELIDTKLEPAMSAWFDIRDRWQLDDWFIEQRVSLESVIPKAFGTADIIAKDLDGRLHILDWKFGDGVIVRVEANDGCAFYCAAALYDDDPELVEFCADITSIVFHIVQPVEGADSPYHTWETNEAWIEKWIDQVSKSVNLGQQEDPPVKAGSWCRWCRAKPICPAYTALAAEALSKPPESMTATDLSYALSQADLLKDWIKSVYTLAQKELESGAAVPGYKLVEKQKRRQWLNGDDAEVRLKRARLKVDEMYKKVLISPPQLEKLRPKLYSQIADEYVILASSGFTIAPDSDKRAAVTGSMELLANALPDQPNEPKQGTVT